MYFLRMLARALDTDRVIAAIALFLFRIFRRARVLLRRAVYCACASLFLVWIGNISVQLICMSCRRQISILNICWITSKGTAAALLHQYLIDNSLSSTFLITRHPKLVYLCKIDKIWHFFPRILRPVRHITCRLTWIILLTNKLKQTKFFRQLQTKKHENKKFQTDINTYISLRWMNSAHCS